MSQVAERRVEVLGASIYYATRGRGPVLLIMGGGPSNADTLAPLASRLADDFTVVTYDRRGYSRSRVDDLPESAAAEPAGTEQASTEQASTEQDSTEQAGTGPGGISRHADDARQLIAALGAGPVSVFGTSFGALIALELAASAPAAIGTLVVHEPPLGQLLADGERQPFDLKLDSEPDAGAALNAIAASVGVSRGRALGGQAAAPVPADVELFIRRDAPAIGDYQLDLARLSPMAGRIVVAGSEGSRDFYPYQCALRLAAQLGLSLAELPGNHAGMMQQPALFAARLRSLLRSPASRAAAGAEVWAEVTK